MRPLEPLGVAEGFGCGLFLFAFGMIFVVMGLAFMPLESASLQSGHWELIFGVFVFVAFGVLVAWGGLAQANLFLRFGKPIAEISADIRPGQTFRFSYTQPFRRPADLKQIGVFLVFREQVSYQSGGDSETSDFDRLIQSHVDTGRPYVAGERLTVEHVFHLPHCNMGIRNPYVHLKKAAVRSFWMLKVRLTLETGSDVWREYELPVAEEGEALLRHVHSEWPEGQFELHLQFNSGSGLSNVSKDLDPILPHLRIGGGTDLYRARPCLLRENLTVQEAEAIKERLAAAGVSVQIRQRQEGESR